MTSALASGTDTAHDRLRSLARAAESAVVEHEAAVARTIAVVEAQRAAVARLREAAGEAARTAEDVAAHARAIAATGEALPDQARACRTMLQTLRAGCERMESAFAAGGEATAALRAGWEGIAAALALIEREGRRARILGINAAIESAVAGQGAGFAIVAERIRALSEETLRDVGNARGIAAATQASAADVIAAASAGAGSYAGIAATLGGADARFDELPARVDALADGVARIAAIADQQRTAAAEIATALDAVDAIAQRLGDEAAAAAHGIGAGVARALDALRGDGEEQRREAVRGLASSAFAAARARVAWSAADEGASRLARELEAIASSVGAAVAAHGLASAAASVAEILAQADAIRSPAVEAFRGAVRHVEATRAHAEQLAGAMRAMQEATSRTGEIAAAVGELSADSAILAINAAIEAARSGARGAAFSIVAGEISRLSDATQAFTAQIASAIGGLDRDGLAVERANASIARDVEGAIEAGNDGRLQLRELRRGLEESRERTAQVTSAADGFADRWEALRAGAVAARRALAEVDRDAREEARLALSELLTPVYEAGTAAGLQLPVDRLRALAEDLAVRADDVFRRALEDGRTTLEQLRDLRYVELRGAEVEHLARFGVDLAGAPRDGFRPPKFRTSWDATVDLELSAPLDTIDGREPLLRSAVVSDLNHFIVAHPVALVRERDWKTNRAKRIIDHEPVALRGARVGLGGGPVLDRPRCTWDDFARAGCVLHRVTPRPWAIGAYVQPSTGDCVAYLGVPVYALEQRVATVVLLADAARMEAAL